MAPLIIIVPCVEAQCTISLNETEINRLINNATGSGDDSSNEDEYDQIGAAHFVIATILVYALIGMLGMLLLRIKRTASRAKRTVNLREESVLKFLKRTDRLMLQARRDVMKRETERTCEILNGGRPQPHDANMVTNGIQLDSCLDLSASLNLSSSMSISPCICLPQTPLVMSLFQSNSSPVSQGGSSHPFPAFIYNKSNEQQVQQPQRQDQQQQQQQQRQPQQEEEHKELLEHDEQSLQQPHHHQHQSTQTTPLQKEVIEPVPPLAERKMTFLKEPLRLTISRGQNQHSSLDTEEEGVKLLQNE